MEYSNELLAHLVVQHSKNEADFTNLLYAMPMQMLLIVGLNFDGDTNNSGIVSKCSRMTEAQMKSSVHDKYIIYIVML